MMVEWHSHSTTFLGANEHDMALSPTPILKSLDQQVNFFSLGFEKFKAEKFEALIKQK